MNHIVFLRYGNNLGEITNDGKLQIPAKSLLKFWTQAATLTLFEADMLSQFYHAVENKPTGQK